MGTPQRQQVTDVQGHCAPPGSGSRACRRAALAAALAAGCALPSGPLLAAPPPACRLVDVTRPSAVTFTHVAARSDARYLPETMGAGVALLDFDLDGDLDLYFLQGGPVRTGGPDAVGANELWRNESRFRFTRVAGAAGAAGAPLGMGACVGDVDADGDPDLHVTNVGPDVLYRNRGDGTFGPAADAGISGDAWTTSCTFVDADGDRDLDLDVAAYVDFDPVAKNPRCGDRARGLRMYCHPSAFDGVRDTFHVNDGTGRFTDATEAAGMAGARGKGLGVISTDADRDGDADLLVANDTTPNLYWQNDGAGRFREVGLLRGFAFAEDGLPRAGMGIVAGDTDGDGLDEVFVTNFDLELNTLYVGGPAGSFRDRTAARGLAAVDRGLLGFGDELADLDLDGDLDLVVVNGHVTDNVAVVQAGLTHAQPAQLLWNDGRGRFALAGPEAGDLGATPLVGRGLAAGDLDGDGDLDLVVTTNDGPARLFRNEGAESRPHVVLELVGTRSNRDAYGARVELAASAGAGAARPPAVRGEVQAARSYLSQGTKRLHLAMLGPSATARVTWPSGLVETFAGLRPHAGYRLVEGAAGASPVAPGLPGYLPRRP
jgi:hypothetical protein